MDVSHLLIDAVLNPCPILPIEFFLPVIQADLSSLSPSSGHHRSDIQQIPFAEHKAGLFAFFYGAQLLLDAETRGEAPLCPQASNTKS